MIELEVGVQDTDLDKQTVVELDITQWKITRDQPQDVNFRAGEDGKS